MKLIRNSSRRDPVKDAIYNPKEFRGGRHPPLGEQYNHNAIPLRVGLVVVVVAAFLLVSARYLAPQPSVSPPRALAITSMKPQPLPQTGYIKRSKALHGAIYAPLKLFGSHEGKHCIFRLEEWRSGMFVLEVFVRGGEFTETAVPIGQYRGKIACGSVWYGDHLFGVGMIMRQLSLPVAFDLNSDGGSRGVMIDLTWRQQPQ